MNGGIDQLVNTYKGNPQPLAQKVQQAQQGQPPGAIPPDLEEAIALQKISELRNSAQGQQAMQAGGAQQSVVEKLRQMLGGMQQQGQMAQAPQQGQPVMAASGGSLDQLMSNLGQYYAGGGIVAFDDGGRGKDKKPLEQYTLQQQGADYVARKQAERLANAQEESSSPSQFVRDVAEIPGAFDAMKQRAREEDAARAAQDARMAQRKREVSEAKQKTSFFNYLFGSPEREKEGLTKLAELSNVKQPGAPLASGTPKPPVVAATPLSDIRGQLNAADAARFAEKPAPKPPADVPAAPRPSATNINAPAANINAPAAAKPAGEAVDPMEAAIRKSIMETMARDPEAVRKKAIEDNAKAMGLEALLKPAQDRAAAREAMIKQIQAGRQPLWIDALMSANKPARGGIAGVLQNMAVGAISGRQNYEAEDLKFLDELNKLNSEIDKAKIEGRYKDVAAGKEAVKDLISEKKQAEASGTSLLNKQATLAQTKQIADDNRKSREMIAASNLEATKAKRLQDQSNFLANLEVKHATLLNNDKDYQGMIKQKQFIELQMTITKDEANRAKLAEQLDTQQAKMASYAASKIGGGTAGAGNLPSGAKFLGFEPSKK
jgi:hypothetical protein